MLILLLCSVMKLIHEEYIIIIKNYYIDDKVEVSKNTHEGYCVNHLLHTHKYYFLHALTFSNKQFSVNVS